MKGKRTGYKQMEEYCWGGWGICWAVVPQHNDFGHVWFQRHVWHFMQSTLGAYFMSSWSSPVLNILATADFGHCRLIQQKYLEACVTFCITSYSQVTVQIKIGIRMVCLQKIV